jgi:hypothetical protein
MGLLGKSEEPASTTEAFAHDAPTPSKPQLKLVPPPGHPLFMQPPAVRAALFASIAKKKMTESKMHADIARKQADTAEQEWQKSVSFATEAAARRDLCINYQLHASLVRSLNRLLGFSVRTEDMVADGKAPLGAEPPELSKAGGAVVEAHAELERIKADINHLAGLILKLKEKEGFGNFASEVKKPLRSLVQQEKRLQEIYDELVGSEAILKEAAPDTHEPPFLPKRLLRPNGEPWWPERPPEPENGAHRLMLVKPLDLQEGFGQWNDSVGAKFL